MRDLLDDRKRVAIVVSAGGGATHKGEDGDHMVQHPARAQRRQALQTKDGEDGVTTRHERSLRS